MVLSTYTLIAPKIRCRFFSPLAFRPVVLQRDNSLYGGRSDFGPAIYGCAHNLIPSELSDSDLATPASSSTSKVVKSGNIIEFSVEYSFASRNRDWKM